MLSTSIVLAATVLAAEGETGSPTVSPYLVGGLTLVLLLVLLLAVISFGGGREHS